MQAVNESTRTPGHESTMWKDMNYRHNTKQTSDEPEAFDSGEKHHVPLSASTSACINHQIRMILINNFSIQQLNDCFVRDPKLT